MLHDHSTLAVPHEPLQVIERHNRGSLFFSSNTQVIRPQAKTGMVTGAMRRKNSMNSHPARSAISRFCGSPTVVQTPPNAVPTAPCIIKLRKKALKSSKLVWCSASRPLSSVWSWPSSVIDFPRCDFVINRIKSHRYRD